VNFQYASLVPARRAVTRCVKKFFDAGELA
jgi:hypothetical protein